MVGTLYRVTRAAYFLIAPVISGGTVIIVIQPGKHVPFQSGFEINEDESTEAVRKDC